MGYKRKSHRAVGSISSETIEALSQLELNRPTRSSSWVQISANSGAPGSSSTIQIRGVSTNGDSRPLF